MKLTNERGETMLARQKNIDLILTSPPYNIGSRAPRCDAGRRTGGYARKSYGGITGYADAMPEEDYQQSQISMLKLMAAALAKDGTLVYNHKPRRKDKTMIHPMQWLLRVPELTLMEEIIWDRGSTHNHSDRLLWPHTERLYVLRRTDGVYRLRNTEAMRFRHDIWRVPLTPKPALGHAAPFPLPLAESVVNTFSSEGDVVCDPYSGSGTTGVAALATRRKFVGSEMCPVYHAASLQRLESVNNQKLLLAA